MPGRRIAKASLALVVAACTAVHGDARPGSPSAAPMATTQAQPPGMQALLDSYIIAGKAQGIVVAIGRGDAPPSFIQAGKIADEPDAAAANPDSLWRIYSMTKPITAIAAMMLIEDGKLSLDQPISDFVPAFRMMRVLDAPERSLKSHPATQPITVRHLLTHTGGLAYQMIGTGPLRDEYKRLGLLGGRADAQGTRLQPASLAEFAERAASVPLLSEPGTQWHYSIGIDVLGRVIEVASGMPLERFLQSRLFAPLGMTSTFWTVPHTQAGRLSTIYLWADGRRVPLDPGASSIWLREPKLTYGGSGLVSSARDYDRFLQMLAGLGCIGNARVLKPETVKLALSNLLPPGVRLIGNGTPDTTRAEGFGAGGWVYLKDVPGGVRAGTYGWFGAGGTTAFIDPETGLRVTVMTNYFPGDKWPLHQDVLKALYSDKNSNIVIKQ